jgi:hypothetical protein
VKAAGPACTFERGEWVLKRIQASPPPLSRPTLAKLSGLVKYKNLFVVQKQSGVSTFSMNVPLILLATVAGLEGLAALDRFRQRTQQFELAKARAKQTNRPLVVVGDPDGGFHTKMLRAYDCGDICLDIAGCPSCPVFYSADITKTPSAPIADNSAVVFVSCVFEYVDDDIAAWHEVLRMAGSIDNLYLAAVQPWTLTATLYPGAKHAILQADSEVYRSMRISSTRKTVALLGVLGLAGYGVYKWKRPKSSALRLTT